MNIVGGQVIVEDGRCSRVDQEEVVSEALGRSRELISRIGLA